MADGDINRNVLGNLKTVKDKIPYWWAWIGWWQIWIGWDWVVVGLD